MAGLFVRGPWAGRAASAGTEGEEKKRMRARVYVTLKPSVFDPQGRVVADALVSLGYEDVKDVRQGKFFEVDLDGAADRAAAEARVSEMADRLLANPVIESYRVEIVG
jgi:phosphoribosylformylglycinamidine synthase